MSITPYHVVFGCSAAGYVFFWIWAVQHAWVTPHATKLQKAYWVIAMIVNPFTPIWYWYIWQRWTFWMLFTPVLGAFVSFPFVIRSLFSRAAETNLADALYALGTGRLLVVVATLLIFPLILRLMALIHLARNTKLSAMDRNDWVVSLALPLFGFGAGVAYCAIHRRVWALISLVWIVALGISTHILLLNLAHVLITAGELKRTELRTLSQ